MHRVEKDNAVQFVDQLFLTFAGELRHIVHVHAGFFRDGQRQCLRRCIHGRDGLMGTDRALCENVSLAFEVVFFIQHFQRAEQEVRAVIRKRQVVGASIDKPIFCREGVIEGIQLPLRPLDGFIGDEAVHLLPDELLHAVPELHHALDALFCRCVQVRLDHDAVFPVIHVTIHDGVGEILHIGVSGNRRADLFVFTEVWQLCLLIFTADVLHCFMEQRSQICTVYGVDGIILLTVLCALRRRSSEHHFRMLREVTVDGKTVFGLA